MRVAAHHRAERAAAAAEHVDAGRAVAGAAGALLRVHLLAGAVDLGAVLDLVGAGAALGELPATQRWIRSVRGSSPKIASDSVDRAGLLAVEGGDLQFHVTPPPAEPPSRRHVGRLGTAGAVGARGHAELAGLRRLLRQRLLHGVAHRDPAALGAGHRALDQDQAALDVGLHHLEIERGHAIDAQMARHLLVLEGLARILAAAGRADRAVRDRHAVRGAQAREIPALHAAGKALADRGAGHVDELADDEMVGRDLGADRDQRRRRSTRNSASLRLGSTLATAKWPRSALLTFFTLRVPEPSCSAT